MPYHCKVPNQVKSEKNEKLIVTYSVRSFSLSRYDASGAFMPINLGWILIVDGFWIQDRFSPLPQMLLWMSGCQDTRKTDSRP